MDFSEHISYLLQFYECVIIPEFGGFISNYKPAQADPENQIFNPPSKEVVFNAKINKNDGLLINHLAETERIGYYEAKVATLNFADQLKNSLEKGGKVELPGVGSLEYNRVGNIIFSPEPKFSLIDAYGLKPVSYPALHHAGQIPGFSSRPAVRALNSRKDVIRIAASVALLLTLSLVPLKNDNLKLQSSDLNPIQLLKNEQPVNINSNIHENKVTQMKNDKIAVSDDRGKNLYILVGGSFQHFENADFLRQELAAKGHQSEIIKQENGFFRVVIDSYPDKGKALLAMKSYRSNHPASNVWISIR